MNCRRRHLSHQRRSCCSPPLQRRGLSLRATEASLPGRRKPPPLKRRATPGFRLKLILWTSIVSLTVGTQTVSWPATSSEEGSMSAVKLEDARRIISAAEKKAKEI